MTICKKNIQSGNLQNLQNIFLKYTIVQNENLRKCYPMKHQFAKKIDQEDKCVMWFIDRWIILSSSALCCKSKASWLLSLEDELQSCLCYVAIPNAALASPASPEHHIVLGLHQGMGLAGVQNFKLNL